MSADIREIWAYTIWSFPNGADLTVAKIVLVLLLVVIGYWLSRLVGFFLKRRLAATQMRPDAIHFVSRLVFYLILIAVILTALSLLQIPLTAFAFVTGAIAIGVGFGAQNILNNFISGWILMTERPIRIDDFIEIDSVFGVVERIGNRSTRIRRSDGVHMLVPNSLLLERTVVNWTLIDQAIRSQVRVGVAYGSDAGMVRDLFLLAVAEQPEVKTDPEPRVIFEDFGDNALIFDAFFWCDVSGERQLKEIRSEIRFRVTAMFDEHNIVIAYPQRDVHLDVSRPLDIRMLTEANSDER